MGWGGALDESLRHIAIKKQQAERLRRQSEDTNLGGGEIDGIDLTPTLLGAYEEQPNNCFTGPCYKSNNSTYRVQDPYSSLSATA